MSFIESPRFPDNIAFSAVGGPGFNTTIVTISSGYESRNVNWSESRYAYDLAIPVRSQSEVDEINAFFRNVKGRAYGFRLRDWSDYQAVKQPTVTKLYTSPSFDYQMVKSYTSGAQSSLREIYKPVSGTVSVYINNVLQTSGYTVDYTTGVIRFTSTISGTVTWSGDFDVPVRFDIDTLQWRVVDRGPGGLLYQTDALPLIEVRT